MSPRDNKCTDGDEQLSDTETLDEPDDHDDFSEGWEERSSNDEFAEFTWLEPLDGTVTYIGGTADTTDHKKVGWINGHLIRRDSIRSTFYHQMEEPTRETSLLAFDLFDRYGCLKPEYINHPIKKGSGIWGEDLDQGDILLIERLIIDKEYRRRGLGRRLVNALLEEANEKTEGFIAVAWPTVLLVGEIRNEIESKTEREQEQISRRHEDIAKCFFRSIGFRRIGSSIWFGLSSDPDHPCHTLPSSDDFDLKQMHHNASDFPIALASAMSEPCDPGCVTKLEGFLLQTPAGDPAWTKVDNDGNTILHIAALNSLPKTVDWILKKEFGSRMRDTRNDAGETPLEAILDNLEKKRTRYNIALLTVPSSDQFEGYSDSAVSCIALLKGVTVATPVDLARLKFGCTCGACIGGFISPRMTLALLCQAEYLHDMLFHMADEESGPDWVSSNDHLFDHISGQVIRNFKTNKSMRQGFAKMFDHMATCLRADIPPTEENILNAIYDARERPPVTGSYLQRGGSIASVTNMCFSLAMDDDEFTGNGEHQCVYEDDIEALPKCRNDHEFGFASGMCGYERLSRIRYVPIF